MKTSAAKELRVSLLKILTPYQHPDTGRSLWQLANTILPYIALWALMFLSLKV